MVIIKKVIVVVDIGIGIFFKDFGDVFLFEFWYEFSVKIVLYVVDGLEDLWQIVEVYCLVGFVLWMIGCKVFVIGWVLILSSYYCIKMWYEGIGNRNDLIVFWYW